MYNEVLPLAIQYGLSEKDFWHGDMRLLEVYQKAYFRDKSYTAWINGYQNFIAQICALSRLGAKSKKDWAEYPKYEEPFNEKSHISEKISEHKAKEEQLRQNAWFSNILHNK